MPFKGFVAKSNFYIFNLEEILPVWTSSDSLCWYSIILRISMTVSYANSASCCTLKLLFTLYLECILSGNNAMHGQFSQYSTPWWWHGSTTFLTTESHKTPFLFSVLAFWGALCLLLCLWISELHHVACSDVFVWYNVFFNCLVIFCTIANGIRGLICPLQEPETLLMSLV